MRKSLTDILRAGNGDSLRKLWETTTAAEEFAPLPAGEYVAHVTAVELFNSKSNNTPGVKLTFKVVEGEYAGRLFWHDSWLTAAALPQAKRDLGKLGVTSLDVLDKPLPKGIRCAVKVGLRKDDDGTERNRVRSFDVIGIDPPEVDPFAPQDGEGEAAEPTGDVDTSFPPAADGGPTA